MNPISSSWFRSTHLPTLIDVPPSCSRSCARLRLRTASRPRILSTLAAVSALALSATAAQSATIGLVLGTWRFALYETPQAKEECPGGFQYKQIEQYHAQFPTPEAKRAQEERFGYYTNRGPNGENVFHFPTVIKDPLPFRPVASTKSYGLNLDGETAGQGSGISAPHENFISPDGEPGIDNQLYRVLGCMVGWRKGGMIDGIITASIRTEFQNRLLLEITDVDDERNDPQVTVTTYRGLDPLVENAAGKLVPWVSQRVDRKTGDRYIHRLRGKIVDGVLMTEPADVLLPSYEQMDMAGDRHIRAMQLRVALTPDGAQGLLGGYVPIDQWFGMFAKTWGAGKIADIQGWSGPATYDALQTFADYRDLHSGRLTGISAAYQIEFGRAFILHDDATVAVTSPHQARSSTESVSKRAPANESVPPGVRIEATDDLGFVFADEAGRTLYTWGADKPDQSNCNDTQYTHTTGTGNLSYYLPDAIGRPVCRQIWPAFKAADGSVPIGKWSIIQRQDGTRQWAYERKAVYTYVHDTRPGEVNGIGGDLGRLLSARVPIWVPSIDPAGISRQTTSAGRVLTSEGGKMLYWLGSETADELKCTNECLNRFKPLETAALATALPEWTVVRRADGLNQWAHRGRLLYTHTGERNGDFLGLQERSWQLATTARPPPLPRDITRQMTPDGEVFADAHGRTLYSFGCVDEAPDKLLCDIPGASQTYRLGICGPPQACIATWQPLPATRNARPVGSNWTVVDVDSTGAQQYATPDQARALKVWAYRGKPVYTYAGDRRAGDMNGHSVRALPVGMFGMLRADGSGPYRGF